MDFEFEPIGIVHSCFKEKFGIPRQPGLVKEAEATLELLPPWDRDEAVRGLESFSHVWVLFLFHQCLDKPWRPTVRPPRLGGNRRTGVFASRSPLRPNPIGLSALELDGIERRAGRLLLRLRGVDLLDGTPVLDIKPYIPYADSIPDAQGSFAQGAPAGKSRVVFADRVQQRLGGLEEGARARLQTLVVRILEQDPRPAYLEQGSSDRVFGTRLLNYEVQWKVEGDRTTVIAIEDIECGRHR